MNVNNSNMNRSEALFPKNKDELYNCVQSKQCTIRKLKGIQHVGKDMIIIIIVVCFIKLV